MFIKPIKEQLEFDAKFNPHRKSVFGAIRSALRLVRGEDSNAKTQANAIGLEYTKSKRDTAHTYTDQSEQSILKEVQEVSPTYNEPSEEVDARIILRDNFERILADNPEVLIFGEDSGQIGGVNQGLEGLQQKFGELKSIGYWYKRSYYFRSRYWYGYARA